MASVSAASAAPSVRVWKDQGDQMPDWLSGALIGAREPNGTYLISTALGRQRVHRGDVVIEHDGKVFSCSPSDADERMRELRQRVRTSPRSVQLIGPGKSLAPFLPRRRTVMNDASKRTYAPARGTPPSIEFIHVDDLKVDMDYQRSIENHASRRLIASIAANWDWRLCTPLAVSRRGDERYVLDGQHRLAAAKMRGDLPHLPCSVANYGGPADEAAMFVAANRARRAINRLDDFHAALVAGDEDALEVRKAIEAAGLKVARQTGSQSWLPGEVAFTSSVQKVVGKHGEDIVTEALTAIALAFKGEVLSNGASIFLGLTRILISPPDGLDRQRLYGALTRHSMKDWGGYVQGIKGGDLRAQTMRAAIMKAYADAKPIAR